MVFYFPLPAPTTKRLCHFQTPAIVVVVVMLEVVAVDVVGLSTLASLTALSFDISLDLDIFSPPIAIYLPLPAPYSFDPVPIPIPGLDRHRISDRPQFPPLLGFADGLIFPPGALIIPGSARV